MRLLDRLAHVSRRLPESRAKVRIGRLVASATGVLGFEVPTVTDLPNGSRMMLDPRGRTEATAFWNGGHEADYLRVLYALADSYGLTAYDIGANVGMLGIPLSRYVKDRGGLVVCFEPVPQNFQRLLENIRLNDVAGACVAYQLALGSHGGQVRMALESTFGSTTGNAVLVHDEARASRSTQMAPLARLDDIVIEEALPLPALIKLDVEGSEIGVLSGAQRVLAQSRPVILGEFNSRLMPRFGHTFLDVVPLLPVGYCIYGFLDGRTLVEKLPAVGLGDVLLVPTEKVRTLPLRIA